MSHVRTGPACPCLQPPHTPRLQDYTTPTWAALGACTALVRDGRTTLGVARAGKGTGGPVRMGDPGRLASRTASVADAEAPRSGPLGVAERSWGVARVATAGAGCGGAAGGGRCSVTDTGARHRKGSGPAPKALCRWASMAKLPTAMACKPPRTPSVWVRGRGGEKGREGEVDGSVWAMQRTCSPYREQRRGPSPRRPWRRHQHHVAVEGEEEGARGGLPPTPHHIPRAKPGRRVAGGWVMRVQKRQHGAVRVVRDGPSREARQQHALPLTDRLHGHMHRVQQKSAREGCSTAHTSQVIASEVRWPVLFGKARCAPV